MTRNADRTAHMAVDSSALRDLAPLLDAMERIRAARIGGKTWEDIADAESLLTGRRYTADEIERFAAERGAA